MDTIAPPSELSIDEMNWIKCYHCDAWMEYEDYIRGGDLCLNCNEPLKLTADKE